MASKFKFNVRDSVKTADGKEGQVTFRDNAGARQNRYAVKIDGNGEKTYFEDELQK